MGVHYYLHNYDIEWKPVKMSAEENFVHCISLKDRFICNSYFMFILIFYKLRKGRFAVQFAGGGGVMGLVILLLLKLQLNNSLCFI